MDSRALLFRAVLASLSVLLILSTFGAPACAEKPPRAKRGLVDLNTIPDNSVSSWSLEGPPGLRKESSPGQFKLVGPVVINVLRVIRPQFTPIFAEWLSSNFSSDPATWKAFVAPPAGPNEFANLTFENPQVQIWGGRFPIDNTTSDYSFQPNNTKLLFSRVSGSVMRNNVDKQNVVVDLPEANAPTLNGKFIRRGKIFELLSGGSFDVPLRSVVEALGGTTPPGPTPPGAAAVMRVRPRPRPPPREAAPGSAPSAAPGPAPGRAPGVDPGVAPGRVPRAALGATPGAAPSGGPEP
ncbi:unnamed protein product [Closterium sp. Naga37s-1]|nr:unnamed protein product [Closterium sp. Naga37s-1]